MTNSESRLAVHEILCKLLESPNVYFQPPDGLKMSYPCIKYSLEAEYAPKANDKTFFKKRRYMLIYIDKNPDSPIPDKFDELEYCSFERTYKSNNLYHFVYTFYY